MRLGLARRACLLQRGVKAGVAVTSFALGSSRRPRRTTRYRIDGYRRLARASNSGCPEPGVTATLVAVLPRNGASATDVPRMFPELSAAYSQHSTGWRLGRGPAVDARSLSDGLLPGLLQREKGRPWGRPFPYQTSIDRSEADDGAGHDGLPVVDGARPDRASLGARGGQVHLSRGVAVGDVEVHRSGIDRLVDADAPEGDLRG